MSEQPKQRSGDKAIAKLAEGLEQLTSSEHFKAWLKARSRFHSYSPGNVVLICTQRPDATKVAGFHAWRQKFNRRVVKGAKGIVILAPVTKKDREDPDKRRMIGVRGAYVFDVSDTEQIAGLPEVPLELPGAMVPLQGDELQPQYGALHTWAYEQGLTIAFEDLGGAHGYYRRDESKIGLERSLPTNAQVKVLLHELAHHLERTTRPDDWPEDYSLNELVAESAAFVVMYRLGHDSSSSIPYIAHWGKGDTRENLARALDRITAIASALQAPLDDHLANAA